MDAITATLEQSLALVFIGAYIYIIIRVALRS